jgi:hypothetical protein
LRENLLDGKSIDYGLNYYEEAIQLYVDEINLYKERQKTLKQNLKAEALTISTAVAFSFIFALMLIMPSVPGITGFASASANTTSEANITVYYAIQKSSDLSKVSYPIPASNFVDITYNATENYAGGSSGTEYYIEVSPDSNADVDICTSSSGPFTAVGSAYELGEGNMTWNDASSTNINTPGIGSAQPYTTSYVKGTSAISPGSNNYYRFWLFIPQGIEPGVYNNTVNFKAVQNGDSC